MLKENSSVSDVARRQTSVNSIRQSLNRPRGRPRKGINNLVLSVPMVTYKYSRKAKRI